MLVNTTTKYIVYNHSGTGVRHHHFSTSNDIIAEAHGHATTGDNVPAQGFPVQWFEGASVPFAFMSVSGGTNGPQLYTLPGNQDVPVGNADIVITVVYAPHGGIGGPGGPGVWLDAFNVDAGTFSDQLHIVQIHTNGSLDNARTSFANQEGVIDTASAGALMRADNTVDGLPFVEWKQILPTQSESTFKDQNIALGQSGEIWIAFYKTADTGGGVGKIHDRLMYTMGGWYVDDYCGNGTGPFGPPHGDGGPFRINVTKAETAKLNATQKAKLDSLMKAYPAAAKAANDAMGKMTDILAGVAGVLGGKIASRQLAPAKAKAPVKAKAPAKAKKKGK